jgi:tetratricopeptide (TPR) repeat protein
MPKSTRSGWHRRTAAVLMREHPELGELRPEWIAWHYESAGEPSSAAAHRKRAADRALARGAYPEAIRHAEQGLELLARVAPSRERAEQELWILESLASAQFSTQGYNAPGVRGTLERALALCRELGDEIPLRVLWGLWAAQVTASDYRGATDLIPYFQRRAQKHGDPVSLLVLHAAIGAYAYYRGDFEQALVENLEALDLYPSPEFQAFVHDYGYDVGIYAFAYLSFALSALGYLVQAGQVCRHMLATAERSKNPYSLAIARGNAMTMLRELGDVAAATELVERQIADAEEQRLDVWIGPATCVRGLLLTQRGELEAGIAEMRRGLERSEQVGFRAALGYMLSRLAEAQLVHGDTEAALVSLDRGLAECESGLDRSFQTELLRLKGACLKSRGDLAAAEVHFRRALELARERNSKASEIGAAQGLAALLEEHGAKQEAAELLGPVIAWFGAGHQVPAVNEAKVFRESLP